MRCKVCDNAKLELLIDLGIQPVAHNYLKSEYDNDIVTHLLKLHYCNESEDMVVNKIHSRRKDILIASLFSPKIIKDQAETLNKSLQ